MVSWGAFSPMVYLAACYAAGGVMGPDGLMHKIEVTMYDDQSDATKAVEVVKKLIEEGKKNPDKVKLYKR